MEAPERPSTSSWLSPEATGEAVPPPPGLAAGPPGLRPPPPPVPDQEHQRQGLGTSNGVSQEVLSSLETLMQLGTGSRDAGPSTPPAANWLDTLSAMQADSEPSAPSAPSAAVAAAVARPPPPPVPCSTWLDGFASKETPARTPPPPGLEATAAAAAEESQEEDEDEEELLQRKDFGSRSMKAFFEQYWDEERIRQGLADGTLIKGTLRVSGTKYSTAHVKPEGAKNNERDLIVRGKSARNRAVHMDVVIIQPLSEAEVHARHHMGDRSRDREAAPAEDEEDDEDEDDDEDDDDEATAPFIASRATAESDSDEEVVLGRSLVKAPAAAVEEAKPAEAGDGGSYSAPRYAKVVAIAEPAGSGRVIVCSLHPNDRAGRETGNCIVKETDTLLKALPTDKRMPWILIQVNDVTRKVLSLPGRLDPYQLWPVQMIGWKETSSLPLGRLKGECLGKAGDLAVEERHALIENNLDSHDVDFEDALLDEVDTIVAEARRSFDDEVTRRLDLRQKRIFTIDPATARDLDDAIHVDLDEERQEVEIGVHIADVSHFLKLGSRVDDEAQVRTTSVYLISRVLPMLPHGLCNHLCSLNPNEPKLAFSAFFRLKLATGELVQEPKPWFKKSAISSVCRLNYDEVQRILDGQEIEKPPVYGEYEWADIEKDLFLLYKVCGKVRTSRMTGGALSISKQKMIFHTRDTQDGIPTGYHLESHSASHWIIEELMLLANRCVAMHLAHSRLSDFSVLRNHEPPNREKADKLLKMLTENLGIYWESKDAGSIYRSCQGIYRKYGATMGLCVEMMTMRAGMMQAKYFVYNNEEVCNGEVSPHHFALNFDYYTHFTSPIRRYPDVMVHRVLDALLTGSDDGFQRNDDAHEQVEKCNGKKTSTRRCSDQIDRAVFCIYLRAQKSWFYTIGTVLAFGKDKKTRSDVVTVYCSQLGRESTVALVSAPASPADFHHFGDVDDTLMLPESFRVCSRGLVELEWLPADGDSTRRTRQSLKMLACVPIVIIPTDTVPIDYALFFVSPFHPRFEDLSTQVTERARRGFEWIEGDEDGVDVLYAVGIDTMEPPPVLED